MITKEQVKEILTKNPAGITIEAHVCPVARFFELPEIIGNDMIDEYTYRTNCI